MMYFWGGNITDTCIVVDRPLRLCAYDCDCYRSCYSTGTTTSTNTCTTKCRSTCYKNILDPQVTLSKCGQKTFSQNKDNGCWDEFDSQFKCYVSNCGSDTFTKGNAKFHTDIAIALFVGGVFISLIFGLCIACCDNHWR